MLKRVFKLSDKGTKDLRVAIFSCILTNIVAFIPFAIIMQIFITLIDPFLSGNPLDIMRLIWFLGGGVVAGILYFIVYKFEYKKTYSTAYGEAEKTRVEVAERLRRLPLSFFNQKDLSELTTNMIGDCTTIEHSMSHLIPQLFANITTIVLACIMLAFYDWRLTLAMFCTLPIAFLIVFLSRKIQKKFGERHVKAKLEVSDQVQEYLDGIKVIKAFGLNNEKFDKMKKTLKNMMKQSIVFEGVVGIFVTTATIILQMGVGLVILTGVILLSQGTLSVVPFLTFVLVSCKIYSPIQTVMTMYPELLYTMTSTKRMQALRDEPLMSGKKVALNSFDIEFEKASFGYNKDIVLKDVSIKLKQGDVTALVGPSGSGKSTVARLISRFWDVDQGKVMIDGKDLKGMDPEHLMTYMSFVFQDVVLFNDTLFNNIRIGNVNASREEVEKAAKMAHCHDFIMKLPDGYDTIIGENGSTLSGGERQRISIARAFLKNAPIVLLDEATASLDPENEILIQEGISKLIEGKTVVVIAHRLRTVVDADKIIVLDEGRVIEEGTGAELLEKNGLFHKLYHRQQESFGWSI